MLGTYTERIHFLDSCYPKWEKQTLWTCFKSCAERYADRPYLICQDDSYSYTQILEMAKAASKSLYALGIRPGDHAAVSLYNGPEYLCLIFALARLGATKVPINMQLSDTEKKYIIRQSDSNWLIGIQIPELNQNDFPALKALIPLTDWNRFLQLGNACTESEIIEAEKQAFCPDGISDILYTSGSTSFPKGVMLRHDALLRTSYATCRTRLMESGRRILVPIPFYHIFAYSEGILASMHVGGSIVISNQRFTADTYLKLLKQHQVNDIICVPLIAIKLLEAQPNAKNFPDMHAAFISPAGPDWLWDSFKESFQISDITTGYGMTECGATSTITAPMASTDIVKEFVGRLKCAGNAGISQEHPHLLQLTICDPESGELLPYGEIGEIVCKGLTVTPGYYKNEDANGSAFRADGWFRTGDLGILEENGLLRFQGRKNDMYKINGENVSPQALELIISKCPSVRQVEIVGIFHEKYGETGVAFIDAEDPDEHTRQSIISFCHEHLASFQVPQYYIFENQENWPRTSTNKVQKGKLRERAKKLI